jgi:predicted GNAT superfamily acetyltransferase
MEIREIRGMTELRAVEDLQKEVWGVDDREVLPAIHMIAAREVGAILLGAFDDGAPVGFVYGFPGFEGEHRVIHSDMLAVRHAWRNRGVGRALKLAQREHALARGIDRITWTFDPLQARNAYLNFVHLGVVADRYLPDFYGDTTSPLHRLGTDRLWVTWSLDRLGPRDVPRDALRIEIPSDIASFDNVAALQWRARTRRQFQEAFAAGSVVTGFSRGEQTCSYALTTGKLL